MKKNFSTTAIMLAVLAVLSGWYLLYEKKYRIQQEAADEKNKQLLSVDKERIQALDVARLGADGKTEKFSLKKTGKDWMLTSPVDDAADSGTVSSMLSTFSTVKQDRIVEESAKALEPYGLDKPTLQITAKLDAGAPVDVFIGADTPTGNSNFVKLGANNNIYKVDRNLKTTFDKDANAVRRKEIFDLTKNDVTEVEIHAGKNEVVVRKEAPKEGAKENKETWVLAREGMPADGGTWAGTLNAITELRATSFAAEKTDRLGDYGLASPFARVDVKKGDGKHLSLLVGKGPKDKDKVYVKREDKPVIYEVDKDFANKLAKPASEYFNKQVADFNRFDVRRVTLERPGSKLELLKDKGAWSLVGDPSVKLDPAKVDGLLSGLQDAKATKFFKGSAGAQPALVVKVVEQAGDGKPEVQKVELKFGAPKAKEVVGEKPGLAMAFAIDDAAFKKIDVKKPDLVAVEKPPAPAPGAPGAPGMGAAPMPKNALGAPPLPPSMPPKS